MSTIHVLYFLYGALSVVLGYGFGYFVGWLITSKMGRR